MDPMEYLDAQRRRLQSEAYAELERLGKVKPGEIAANRMGLNDWVDAYRHAYASAKLRQDHGWLPAFVLGDVREALGPITDETWMDLENNGVGREVVAQAARELAAGGRPDLAAMVLKALDQGRLITNTSDPRNGPGLAAARARSYLPDLPSWSTTPESESVAPAPHASTEPRYLWAPRPDVDPQTGEPLKPIEWWQKRPPEPSLVLRRLLGM